MIEIRPACPKDAEILQANLHPLTRSELDNAGVSDDNFTGFLKDMVEAPGASAVYVDGALAVIANSSRYSPGVRATSFVAATCSNRDLVLAMRRWRSYERAAHPGQSGISFSYSTHPDRDRFFGVCGMKKIKETPRFCVFSDSQDALDFPQ